jgi:hypothetical protein
MYLQLYIKKNTQFDWNVSDKQKQMQISRKFET